MTPHQLLYRAFNGQKDIFRPTLEELGLGRGQPRILTYLYENGESSQNDIASYFSIDPASVSRMTENLQSNGFITRREDRNHRNMRFWRIRTKRRLHGHEDKSHCHINDV